MAALVAVVRLVKAGQHIVAGDDIYGGTSRLLLSVVPHQGIEVTNVDMTDIRCVPSLLNTFWSSVCYNGDGLLTTLAPCCALCTDAHLLFDSIAWA